MLKDYCVLLYSSSIPVIHGSCTNSLSLSHFDIYTVHVLLYVSHIDRAELQVITTCDYCTDSWFWYIISGGINHQTAHHLFPDMAQGHYLWVTPLLEKTCKEFGIQYNCMKSFGEAWKKHIEYLKNMGEDVGSKKSG